VGLKVGEIFRSSLFCSLIVRWLESRTHDLLVHRIDVSFEKLCMIPLDGSPN
jgi:hypothetical protein